MNSGTSPVGQTTSVQRSDPWSGVQPFLERQYAEANRLYNTGGPQFYPFSTVTPFARQTEAALTGMENRATQGSPLLQAGQQQMGSTIAGAGFDQFAPAVSGAPGFQAIARGDYLQPETNPYLAATYDQAADRVREQVGQSFGGHGFGGTTHQEILGRNLGNLATNLYGQNFQQERARQAAALGQQYGAGLGQYGAERGRQFAATQGAPMYSQAGYQDLDRLAGVGATRESLGEAQLADAVQRFNFQQQAPFQNLARFQAGTSGTGQYGDRTTIDPIYRNRAGGMLSGGMAGGMMSQMAPGVIPPWLGVLGGAALGGFG